jgi:hypothetical protein
MRTSRSRSLLTATLLALLLGIGTAAADDAMESWAAPCDAAGVSQSLAEAR